MHRGDPGATETRELTHQEERKGELPQTPFPGPSAHSLLGPSDRATLLLRRRTSPRGGTRPGMCSQRWGLAGEGGSGGNRQPSGPGRPETREEEIETRNSDLRTDIISLAFSVRTEVNCPLGRTEPKSRHERLTSE